MSLQCLPTEPQAKILSFLPKKDAGKFSHLVSKSLLTLKINAVEHEHGQSNRNWDGHWQIYHAKKWFEIPLPDNFHQIHTVELSFRWKDQGWGNRKGMISVVRKGGEGPGDDMPWGDDVVAGMETAPHEFENVLLTFRPELKSKESTCTDYERHDYEVWVRIGGGGGHKLFIHDLKMTIYMYSSE